MRIAVKVYQDENGTYFAVCPAIPGCFSQGKSEKEARENLKYAIKDSIKERLEKKLPLCICDHDCV
ncbi:hypothetical protein LCGC14_1831040 [marine sediment metagenome]|uniref:HicB-like antitoxin of toxin-antitoxin system domain-containing protein n=1 Tax=marine sediment metagenome TaxID=412755 RepID=A0A0F9JFP7_9ZZZZ